MMWQKEQPQDRVSRDFVVECFPCKRFKKLRNTQAPTTDKLTSVTRMKRVKRPPEAAGSLFIQLRHQIATALPEENK